MLGRLLKLGYPKACFEEVE